MESLLVEANYWLLKLMKVVHYIKTGVESLLTISDHSVNFFDISRYSNASNGNVTFVFFYQCLKLLRHSFY